VSSVSKRRRERLRAKRKNAQAQALTPPRDKPARQGVFGLRGRSESDTHVAPAGGRQAKRRRQELHREADKTESVGTASPLPDPSVPRIRAKSLREKRAERRQWRLRREGTDPNRPEVRVRPLGVVWVSWRWLSGALSIILLAILYMMWFTDIFIIDSMAIGGERYITREQIFQASNVANKRIFEVDPRDVEARLKENPSIANAQVFIGWPPNMISVFITERDPALVWEQGNFRVWVDVNGIVMFQREERPDLVRVINTNTEDEFPLGVGATINREVVAGALQLKAMFPNIESLMYDERYGLGYRDGRNWTVWFGTGTNMEIKYKVYDKIVKSNPEVAFDEIFVVDHDHPYFSVRFPTQ
jgi:cell division septal protein FtsQ